MSSTLTYNVDNINNQGVQDLFADILFEASSLSRCDTIPTETNSSVRGRIIGKEKSDHG